MNKFLNENFKDINKELGSILIEPIKQLVFTIFQKITAKYSLLELFKTD